MSNSPALIWQAASQTHKGNIRKLNEDAILARTESGLWAVADGMGGHEAGDVASRMVVDALREISPRAHLSDFVDQVEDAVIEANRRLIACAQKEHGGRTMGSTLVVMAAKGEVGVTLWAGDSRLYRLRKGELEQLTQDHSQVGEMVVAGLISEDEARNHPASNIITRAVGSDPQLHLDINVFDVCSDDLFLLCSDGLHGEISKAEIKACLASRDPQQAADRLIAQCLAGRAKDNVSVIVVRAAAV